MEFDTILTEEEIKNNISGIIKDDKGLFKNIVTYYVGDITNGLKMEGYINGNSFHLVSYLEFYKKNVEINGSIIDLGNLRKVKFDVNWKKQFDIIILFLFIGFSLSFIIGSIYNIPLLIMLFGFIGYFIILVNITIFLNKHIVRNLEKTLFKIIIKSKYIE